MTSLPRYNSYYYCEMETAKVIPIHKSAD